MDPDEALRQIRAITNQLVRGTGETRGNLSLEHQAELGTELAELCRGLDEWLVNRGFYPSAWSRQALTY